MMSKDITYDEVKKEALKLKDKLRKQINRTIKNSLEEMDSMFAGDEYGIEHLIIIKEYIQELESRLDWLHDTIKEQSDTIKTQEEHLKRKFKQTRKLRYYIRSERVDLDNKSEWGICDKYKDDILNEIEKLIDEVS